MTQMTEAPAPPPPPPAAVPLVRSRQDRVVLGVCAAVGRSTGTDPVLWRVVVGVLTLFGGSGLLLYAAGWALIRDEDEAEAPADRLLRRRADRLSPATVVAVIAVVLLAVAALGGVDPVGWVFDGGLVPLAVVALLGYLVVRRRGEPRSLSEPAPLIAPPVPDAPRVPPAPAAPKGPPVALLTTSAALLVGALLVGLAAAGADGITAPRVGAAVLAVLGVGLVVGARHGRQLGLITLALLALGSTLVTARLDIPFDGSAGNRVWAPTSSATDRLGVGTAELDLTALTPTAPVVLRPRVGAGRLEIVVPQDLRVLVHAEAGVGVIDLPGEGEAASGDDLSLDRAYGPGYGHIVRVDARVGVGQLVVSRG